MQFTKFKLTGISGFLLLNALYLGASTLIAAPDDVDDIEEIEEVDSNNAASKIADDFSDLAGDDSAALVEALRNGDSITFEAEVPQDLDEDGEQDVDANGDPIFVTETVTVENTNGQMGYGEISLALGLADSLLEDGASMSEIMGVLYTDAGDGILDLRASGMGWGQIFREYDLTVGEVMRGLKSNGRALAKGAVDADKQTGRPDVTATRGSRPNRPERAGRPERPEKPEKPEKPERPERPEKPERANR